MYRFNNNNLCIKSASDKVIWCAGDDGSDDDEPNEEMNGVDDVDADIDSSDDDIQTVSQQQDSPMME